MIYQFIKNHESVYPIEKMCKVLDIGQRSYYDWKRKAISSRRLKSIFLKEKIKAIYFDKKQRYGSPRITAELQLWELKFLGLLWPNI